MFRWFDSGNNIKDHELILAESELKGIRRQPCEVAGVHSNLLLKASHVHVS